MPTHYINGLEVTVIDDSDYVGVAESITRVNEIYMHDIKSMVSNVIKFVTTSLAFNNKIARLNILDHGNPKGFEIGQDFITMGTFPAAAIELVKLRPYFQVGAFVHLQHCDIGQNENLIIKLAQLLGVKVYAGTGKQNNVYRINIGGKGILPFENYVVADPNGTCRPTSRPDFIDNMDIKIPIPMTPYNFTVDL